MNNPQNKLKYHFGNLHLATLLLLIILSIGKIQTARAQGCCQACRPNLAIDGPFADSCNNYRFHTDLHILCPIPTSMRHSGYGAIIHSTNGIAGTSHGLYEHTGLLHSHMLFGKDTSVPIRAWFDTVKVVNWQTYCFSVWVRNMCD